MAIRIGSLALCVSFIVFIVGCSYGSGVMDAGDTGTVSPDTGSSVDSGVSIADGGTDSGTVSPDTGSSVDSGSMPLSPDAGAGTTPLMASVLPGTSLASFCPDRRVFVTWGPAGEEYRSAVGALSFTLPMASATWRGWVRIQAFCPAEASRGSERGYWVGETYPWSSFSRQSLRNAGLSVFVGGTNVSDYGLVCMGIGGWMPTAPVERFAAFECPPT